MHRPGTRKRAGVSLIEVLVVLAILVILAGLMFMYLRVAGEVRAPQVGCQNNIRQLCLASINCADTYQGRLPPLVGPFPDKLSQGTLFFHLLPFMEQNNLYKAAGDGKSYSVWNANTFGKEVETYVCPNDTSRPEAGLYKGWLATSSYAGNGLVFGDSKGKSLNGANRFPASIADGTSNTIFFTERFGMCAETPCAWGYAGDYYWAPVFAYFSKGKFQTRPAQDECNPALAQSPHEGGINVGMGDGSARFVASTISPQTWWRACTPAAGDILGTDW